jgi:hypothetical protein
MVEKLSAAGQHIALPDAIMITGTDDHDPPETMITINWIERSRWSGIGDHDRPECTRARARTGRETLPPFFMRGSQRALFPPCSVHIFHQAGCHRSS